MKSKDTTGQSFELLVPTVRGPSFYARLLVLLCLIVGLAVSTQVRAHTRFENAARTAAENLGTATTSDALWVNIRVASLPRQITLCRDLGPDADNELSVDEDGEYEWIVLIDADGNPVTGNPAYNGAEAVLSIYTIDPRDPYYFLHGCVPHAVDTTMALKADLIDLRADTTGQYPFTRTAVPVVIDFAHNALSVALNHGLPELAKLSPAATFDFSAWGIYQGAGQAYAIDFSAPLRLGSNLPVSTSDASNDVGGCVPTAHEPSTQWCQSLDVVGVTLAAQATVPPDIATVSTVPIDANFTGSWFDPTQSGQGLMLEVLSDKRLLAFWFSFNPAGDQQAWFGGVGTYSGNTATITDVALPTGGRWIPNFNQNAIVLNPWGTLTFTFSDCNHGKVDFNSVYGYGSGSMNLTRLTLPAGLTCQ